MLVQGAAGTRYGKLSASLFSSSGEDPDEINGIWGIIASGGGTSPLRVKAGLAIWA